ncbi:MAG: hypothetical protein ACI9MC_003721 [Kiritimatiellia bacterium]
MPVHRVHAVSQRARRSLHDQVRAAGDDLALILHRPRDDAIVQHLDDVRILQPGDRADLAGERAQARRFCDAPDLDGDREALLPVYSNPNIRYAALVDDLFDVEWPE